MHKLSAMLLASMFLAMPLFAACDRAGGAGGVRGRAVLDGVPASGAEVNIYDVPEKGGAQPVVSVQTDVDGRFSAPLEPGTYYIAVKMNSPDGGPPALSKLPPDPAVVDGAVVDVGDMLLMRGQGTEKPPPGTGVSGRVEKGGSPLAGAVVYLYENMDTGLRGPTYYASERTDETGGFRAGARPGRYYVAVRKRFSEASAGELSPGDLGGVYPGNPVTVKADGYSDIGAVAVDEIDAGRLDGLKIGVKEDKAAAAITGRVTDESGSPLDGVYVFAYEDYRMVGKPSFISGRTGRDGRYTLLVDRPGRYYLGGRDSVGGPMEPGDMVGVYGGSKDNSVNVGKGGRLDGTDMVLKEVQ